MIPMGTLPWTFSQLWPEGVARGKMEGVWEESGFR